MLEKRTRFLAKAFRNKLHMTKKPTSFGKIDQVKTAKGCLKGVLFRPGASNIVSLKRIQKRFPFY